MKQEQYIEVAVALPVSHTFTYKVPEHFAQNYLIGMRVLVPFGRRRITGYVLATKEENGSCYKSKLILDLLDDIPLFPPSMIPLFHWISRYYIHPIGEVIRTALPVGLDSHDVSLVVATQKGVEKLNLNLLTPAESYVINQLQAIGDRTLPLKSLTDMNKKNSGKSPVSYALIKKMVKDDLIEITSELKKDKTRIKMEKFISISPSLDKRLSDLELSDLDNSDCDTLLNRLSKLDTLSKKRQAIIQIVSRHNEISMAALKKEVPTAPKLVPIMAETGYLTILERQVFRDPFGDAVEPDIPPELTDEQAQVVNQVREKIDAGFQRYLLSGVTGSGKTEVYMRLVTDVITRGMRAIMLVPEISLISQTERRFRARFGNRVAILHSGLSKGELLDQWHRIAKGEVSIVIGARSAIFAPVANLGIIIVDEEHDTSYKQETGLRYNARDIAIVRAQQHNIPVILGSATPSIQSYYNACQGRFEELFLKKRVNRHPLPEITLVDLKKYKDCGWRDKLVTPELSKEISACLAKGEQVLIFLNRRGFATFPVCESCGEAIKCKFCDITMTLHKDESEFRCHLCGFSISSTIDTANIRTSTGKNFYSMKVSSDIKCLKCGSAKIKPLGFGTERIETLLKSMYPDARIIRLDQDTGGKKGATVQILKKVKNRTVDIIVGTQMLAKGHDFPAITLVGVICADLSLNFPDFRAGERTFQLLAQVAGRAGRGDRPGKVIMQTYNPEHFSIEASKNQDFVQFYNSEIPFRKALSYPPFSRIIQLKISGLDIEKVKAHALLIGEICNNFIEVYNQKENPEPVQMLGPIEAGIPKISMRYRWQILFKSPSATLLNRIVHHLISDKKSFAVKEISIGIDVDPYFMM
ncbi:MAG: primosomal protein N' [Desulfamplus sp.]|nr:primosomal protein N' [Desulfamplus sp.]